MQGKSFSRRVFLKSATFSAVSLTLAACAAPVAPTGGAEAGEQAAAPASEAIEIIHFDRNIPQDIEFRTELADRFATENPNISVKIETMPDDYAATLITRIASGTAGDCFRYGTHYGLANLALRGIFAPLDEFVAQDNYDLSIYFKGSIDACRVEGKLYALPVNGHPGWSAIYYMPELFAEAGVPEPTDAWTYDDMTNAAIELTKGSGAQIDQYGLWVAPFYEASLTPISAFGGWPMSEDGTKALFDDEKTIAGVRWIRDVMHEQKVALPNPTFDSRVQLWSSSKVAMVLSGIWEGSYLGDATPEGKTLKVATGPIGPSDQRGGFVGVNVFPILQNSKHPYETWLWQKFLCSKQVGIENVKRIGEPGLRTDVWEDETLVNDPLVKPHYELLKTVKPMPVPANGRLSEIADPVQQIYSAIWLNELSVEDGCAQIQEKLQGILDQPKPGA